MNIFIGKQVGSSKKYRGLFISTKENYYTSKNEIITEFEKSSVFNLAFNKLKNLDESLRYVLPKSKREILVTSDVTLSFGDFAWEKLIEMDYVYLLMSGKVRVVSLLPNKQGTIALFGTPTQVAKIQEKFAKDKRKPVDISFTEMEFKQEIFPHTLSLVQFVRGNIVYAKNVRL